MSDDNKSAVDNKGVATGQEPVKDDGSNTDIHLNQVVSSIVSSQLKKALSPKELSSLLGPLVVDAIRAANAANASNEQNTKTEPKATGSEVQRQDPEVAALKQRIQQIQEERDREQKIAAKAKKKQRNERTFTQVKDLLTANNVRPDMVEIGASMLVKAEKRVEYGEDGKALLRVKTSPGKGFAEEDKLLPLEDGIQQFLKSKAGAVYLAPPGGGARQEPQRKATPVVTRSAVPVYESEPVTDTEKARRAMEQMAAAGVSL